MTLKSFNLDNLREGIRKVIDTSLLDRFEELPLNPEILKQPVKKQSNISKLVENKQEKPVLEK